MKTPIILGFDLGLIVKLFILDLNGNLLFLKSFKEIVRSEIITTIMEYGKAILIATDVENPLKAVKKLASSLNAKIFSPKSDISVSHKNEIVNEFLKNENDISFNSNNKHNNHNNHNSHNNSNNFSNSNGSNNFNNASVNAQ